MFDAFSTTEAFVDVLGEAAASWLLSIGAELKTFRIDESSVHVAPIADRLGVAEPEGLSILDGETARVVSETDSANFQSGRSCTKGMVESGVPDWFCLHKRC